MNSILFKKIRSGIENAHGDTIVEVMISMAVLALVIAATYSLSTRAYTSGLNAQYRDQAVSLAQQQLELIKEADNQSPSNISSVVQKPYNKPYCIAPDSKTVTQAKTTTDCIFNAQYKVTYVYDDTSSTIKVTASWDAANGINQQTFIYYKPNDSYTTTVKACTAADPLCAPVQTNAPKVTVTSSPASMNAGSTATIGWTSNNVNLSSCVAKGTAGTGFPGYNVQSNPGSFSFNTTTATAAGTYSFEVDCNDNAGNPVAPSIATVTVTRPLPNVTTSSPTAVAYNTATLHGNVDPQGFATSLCKFYYDTASSYSAGTSLPGHGSSIDCSPMPGTSAQAVAATISTSATTTYYFQLCSTNTFGTTCSAGSSFSTPAAPPPPPSATLYQCTTGGRLDAPCSPSFTGCSVSITKGQGNIPNSCGTTIMGSIQFFNSPGYFWPVTVFANARPDLGVPAACENFYQTTGGLNDGIANYPRHDGGAGNKIYRSAVYALEADYTDPTYGDYGCSNQNH